MSHPVTWDEGPYLPDDGRQQEDDLRRFESEPIVQFNRGEYIQILVDAGIPKDRAEKEADELYRSL